jgi:tRNA pseudouridine synthase 10
MQTVLYESSVLGVQYRTQWITLAIENGCCTRCALCLGQCVKQSIFETSEEIVLETLHKHELLSTQVDASQIAPVCVVCRNLFRDEYLFNKLPELAQDHCKNYEFKLDEFTVGITLSPEFIIRDHCMLVFLQHKVGLQFKPISDRKRLLKNVLTTILFNKLVPRNGAPEVRRMNIMRKPNPPMLIEFNFTEGEELASPKRKKRKFDREKKNINQELTNITTQFDFDKLSSTQTVPPPRVESNVEVVTRALHEPIYISGNYCKFERDLPQSPWLIKSDDDEGEQENDSSVEDLIVEHLKPLIEPESHKFDSAGREDRDVRMLGNGRPFVVTMLNPKKSLTITEQDLALAQEKINHGGRISVHSLKLWHDNTRSKEMHAGANEKQKRYRCVVWCSGKITQEAVDQLSNVNELVIKQNTPVRVLHRRAAAIREKIIHSIRVVEKLNDHYMVVDLMTSAGTYVKEFVSSDFGRTIPSMGTLIAQFTKGQEIPFDAQLLQLDVVEIVMD